MANTLNLGDGNWGVKDSSLLGYAKDNTKFVPETFDVTRASGGTRVNKDGLIETVEETLSGELITNGDFDTDTWWLKSSANVNISNGKGNYTAGTPVEYFYKLNVLTVGKEYKLTYEITDYTTGYITGYGGNWSIVAEDVGVQEVYFTANDAGFGLVGYNFIGSIDNVSVIEINQDNLARIDYTDGIEGVLLTEPQSTNLLTHSSDFSHSTWNKQAGITPTYNTTETLSPDGTYNATKFIGIGTSGVFRSSIAISGDVARSVYLKSVSGTTTVRFKDPNGTGGATHITLTITNEWQRFELLGDTNVSNQGLWIDDITSDGLYMWGAQVENLPYATSYIPTYGQIASRAADLVKKESIPYLSGSHTVFAHYDSYSNITGGSLRDWQSASNKVYLIYNYGGGLDVFNNSSFIVDRSTLVPATNFKIAIVSTPTTVKIFINGVDRTKAGATPNTTPITKWSNDINLSQEVKSLKFYNEALTDEELYNLTSDRYATYDTMATDLTFDKQ